MNLNERLSHNPEPWRPEPGDQLVGTVVDIAERETEYGTYPMVTIATAAGDEFCWHAFHTVAKNELAKQRPVVGDELGVRYNGKDPNKGYERYRVLVVRYRVLVERTQPADLVGPNWDAMAKESAVELSDLGEDQEEF